MSINDRLGQSVMPFSSIPLMERKYYNEPSILQPSHVINAVRRQRSLPSGTVPVVCILDPDGDIAVYVRDHFQAKICREWACFHTVLWEWQENGTRYGVVGGVVGASFAVLVAEQLFETGCELLISVASAGELIGSDVKQSFVLIEKALRDEGTSYHYLPAAAWVDAPSKLIEIAQNCASAVEVPVRTGTSWTTDAPFRETAQAIELRRSEGISVVEMEAAALYAFARARQKPVLCLAYITNAMGQDDNDFEKGERNGALFSLTYAKAITKNWYHFLHGPQMDQTK